MCPCRPCTRTPTVRPYAHTGRACRLYILVAYTGRCAQARIPVAHVHTGRACRPRTLADVPIRTYRPCPRIPAAYIGRCAHARPPTHGKKTGADKTRGNTTKTPKRGRCSNAAAKAAGPRPERSDMARDAARAAATGPRPGARRIAACGLKLRRGRRGASPWEWSAAAPYWLKIRRKKLKNISIG